MVLAASGGWTVTDLFQSLETHFGLSFQGSDDEKRGDSGAFGLLSVHAPDVAASRRQLCCGPTCFNVRKINGYIDMNRSVVTANGLRYFHKSFFERLSES